MKRILIVDDNEENLYLLRVLLEGHGYEAEQAANGSEALVKARASRQDMIISDILMPVMDGFTLCRALKADERLKHIPLIFYTATYTDPRDEKLALGMGANAFLIKPMETDEFMRRIEEILAANKDGKLNASQKQTAGDEVVLKEYNEVLINKLEQKMFSLEQANKALEAEIAARKQAEESLLKSEGRLSKLYESGLLGVFYWNRDGQVTDANDKFLDMIGYRREDMAAGRINGYRMTPLEFKIVDERSVSELHTAGVNKIPLEKEYIRKDGTRLPIMIAGALLDREQFNGIAFVLDITERKIAESQREAALEEIKKLNRKLERDIDERTAKLKETIVQLEEINRVFVGRELKMAELKERIAELEKKT